MGGIPPILLLLLLSRQTEIGLVARTRLLRHHGNDEMAVVGKGDLVAMDNLFNINFVCSACESIQPKGQRLAVRIQNATLRFHVPPAVFLPYPNALRLDIVGGRREKRIACRNELLGSTWMRARQRIALGQFALRELCLHLSMTLSPLAYSLNYIIHLVHVVLKRCLGGNADLG